MQVGQVELTEVTIGEKVEFDGTELVKDIEEGTYDTSEGFCSTYLVKNTGGDNIHLIALWDVEGENIWTNVNKVDAIAMDVGVNEKLLEQLNAYYKSSGIATLSSLEDVTVSDLFEYVLNMYHIQEVAGGESTTCELYAWGN